MDKRQIRNPPPGRRGRKSHILCKLLMKGHFHMTVYCRGEDLSLNAYDNIAAIEMINHESVGGRVFSLRLMRDDFLNIGHMGITATFRCVCVPPPKMCANIIFSSRFYNLITILYVKSTILVQRFCCVL